MTGGGTREKLTNNVVKLVFSETTDTFSAIRFLDSYVTTISGTVYDDRDGSGTLTGGDVGTAGVTVSYTGPNGSSGSTTTDENGLYSFTEILEGAYSVTYVIPTDWVNTGTRPVSITIASATGAGTVNLYTRQSDASIAGTVYSDLNGNGSVDVVCTAAGGEAPSSTVLAAVVTAIRAARRTACTMLAPTTTAWPAASWRRTWPSAGMIDSWPRARCAIWAARFPCVPLETKMPRVIPSPESLGLDAALRAHVRKRDELERDDRVLRRVEPLSALQMFAHHRVSDGEGFGGQFDASGGGAGLGRVEGDLSGDARARAGDRFERGVELELHVVHALRILEIEGKRRGEGRAGDNGESQELAELVFHGKNRGSGRAGGALARPQHGGAYRE